MTVAQTGTKTARMVKTTIDGREVEVERDRWVLEVAREMGIAIPTLCYHPALEPYGACRLCVVEVTRGKRTWLTTSCDLPVREGMSIRTDTPAVIRARKMALELLWAQAPQSEEIAALARELGVDRPRFGARDESNRCILCGLCVRVCDRLVGAAAIGFSHRGVERQVGSPFHAAADACIGCGACVAVCPTGHIRSIDDGPIRRMETWATELALAECEVCGRRFAPVKQLDFLRERVGEHLTLRNVCAVCRRIETARRLSQIVKSPSTSADEKEDAQPLGQAARQETGICREK